jgi:thioester reductase-like protein
LSGAIPTAEGMVQALKMTSAEIALVVPSIVTDLSQKPQLLDYCSKHLELMLYLGGDLPQAIGDKVAAKLHLRCNYGASEFGLAAQLLAPEMTRADWRYIMYHPNHRLNFEEITPGIFELVLKRDPKYEAYQLPFAIGPSLQDLQIYRTRDLFVKHPTIPDCWGWRARADDIIVFLNGEKTNPVSMEQHIMAENADVSAVLVVGMQRFQAGLLIETATKLGNIGEENAFIEQIWPSIDEANKLTPAHARVEMSMVLFTSPEKPMIRSGKGTIQRQSTVALYAAEIDDLYLRAETELSGAGKETIDTKDVAQVSKFLEQAILRIEPDLLQEGADNFFALGMDSLMAIRIIRALRHGLGRPELEVSAVYNNPSVDSLARYVVHGEVADGAEHGASHKYEIESLLKEYESKIQFSPKPEHSNATEQVVILTGSTGSLGVHLLEALLVNPSISHVYCLNRRKNARDIHKTKASETGFPLRQHMARVTFLHAILHEPNFGIDQKTYSLLRATTTLIIHNAWTVNFSHPLQTFRPQLDGLVNLLNFASARQNAAKFFYVSSISSVANLPHSSPSTLIPEHVVRHFEASFEIGYAQSKLVAELLCDTAAQRLKIPVSFARVGQIGGPVEGHAAALWNTVEWLPSLILTSISLGALPDDLGTEMNRIDWIPVDILAKVLVELGTILERDEDASDASHGAAVFNLLNPRSTSWRQILPSFVSSIQKHSRKDIDLISMTAWLAKLRQVTKDVSADNTDLVRTHPAIKLQEFYEARMRKDGHSSDWEMNHATAKSKTLKDMPAVSDEWIEKWVKAWVTKLE